MLKPTKEHEDAIKVLQELIATDEYKDLIRKNIDLKNEQFRLIEESLKVSPQQRSQEYNI